MARRTKKVKSAGRFQSRYGLLVRKRVRDIEEVQRAYHVCPKCGQKKVKRVSTSIWECRKCGTKFAGGAYVPKTDMGKIVERILRGEIPSEEVLTKEIEAEKTVEEKEEV
jgi:large subunit ribosomal protein L37Ae